MSRLEFFQIILAAIFGTKYWPVIKGWLAPVPPKPVIAPWDPLLISLVRQSMPKLMAYDICNVQPMCGPTGMLFAMTMKRDIRVSLFDEVAD